MEDCGRKWLWHDTPSWVDPDASDYFITICCQRRGVNQLCVAGVGEAILSAARFYHARKKWFPSPLVVMPDHVHMLVGFGREEEINEVVGSWKRYLSRQHGVVWQRNFFEHRLRSHESVEEKAEYILQNPVRAGFVKTAAEWPFVLALD